jgi:hypothetical protein
MQFIIIYFVGILLGMLAIGAYRGYMNRAIKDLPLEYLVILWPVVGIFGAWAFVVCCIVAAAVSVAIFFHNVGRYFAVKVRQLIRPE